MQNFEKLDINEWKKSVSIRFYTKLTDPPLQFQPLIAPVLLFGLYYGLDGSLYTEHYAKVETVLYEQVETGNTVTSKELVITPGDRLKTSFHGSGEIVGFERSDETWQRSHLGFALRDIEGLTKLASQWIGTAGHYLGQFEKSRAPSSKSVVIPGLFEIAEVPVFNIWAGPVDGPAPSELIVASATTRELKNGKKISIHITLDFWVTETRPGDPKLIAYVSKAAST